MKKQKQNKTSKTKTKKQAPKKQKNKNKKISKIILLRKNGYIYFLFCLILIDKV
jgi:hypothetical protein